MHRLPPLCKSGALLVELPDIGESSEYRPRNLPGKNRVLCLLRYRLIIWWPPSESNREAPVSKTGRYACSLQTAVVGSAPWIRTTIPRFKVSSLAIRRAPRSVWCKAMELNHPLESFNLALIRLSYPCIEQRALGSPGFRLPALNSGLVAVPIRARDLEPSVGLEPTSWAASHAASRPPGRGFGCSPET